MSNYQSTEGEYHTTEGRFWSYPAGTPWRERFHLSLTLSDYLTEYENSEEFLRRKTLNETQQFSNNTP